MGQSALDVLALIGEQGEATAWDVAVVLGCGEKASAMALVRLHRRGDLQRQALGNGFVYRLSGQGARRLAGGPPPRPARGAAAPRPGARFRGGAEKSAEPEFDVAELERLRRLCFVSDVMGVVRWEGFPRDLLAQARQAVTLEVDTCPATLSAEQRWQRAEQARDRVLRGGK